MCIHQWPWLSITAYQSVSPHQTDIPAPWMYGKMWHSGRRHSILHPAFQVTPHDTESTTRWPTKSVCCGLLVTWRPHWPDLKCIWRRITVSRVIIPLGIKLVDNWLKSWGAQHKSWRACGVLVITLHHHLNLLVGDSHSLAVVLLMFLHWHTVDIYDHNVNRPDVTK